MVDSNEKLTKAQLGELFEQWANDPKPDEYKYALVYNCSPSVIWWSVHYIYYGIVHNGVTIMLKSAIKRKAKRIVTEPELQPEKKQEIIDYFTISKVTDLASLAVLTQTNKTITSRVITEYITNKHNKLLCHENAI